MTTLENRINAARGVYQPTYKELQQAKHNERIRHAIKNGMPIHRKESLKPSYLLTIFVITMVLISIYSISSIIEKI